MNETFGEDAMFVYLVRNYPCRNRVKYPPFRENIPLWVSTDKFSLYYTWRMKEEVERDGEMYAPIVEQSMRLNGRDDEI